MFKNLLVVFSFWCYCGGYARTTTVKPSRFLTKSLDYPVDYLSIQEDTQSLQNVKPNVSDIPDNIPGSIEKIPVINNMHGHNIHHYDYVGQIIYTYDGEKLKQLLDMKRDTNNKIDKRDTDINNEIDKNNDDKYNILKLQGYSVIPKIGAYKLHSNSLSWNDARHACIEEGGHLAIINSESQKNRFVRMLDEDKLDTAWLGVHDLFQENEWVTVSGDPFETTSYIKWAQNGINGWMSGDQPNNLYNRQNCMELVKEGMLNDKDCSELNSFFCEIPV